MKNYMLLLAFVFLTFTACQKEEIVAPTIEELEQEPIVITTQGTVLEFFKYEEDYSLFYNTLFRTGLGAQLLSKYPLTVFAPTDSVILAYLEEHEITSFDDMSPSDLETLVKVHISIEGAIIISQEMVKHEFKTLQEGAIISVGMRDFAHPSLSVGTSRATIEKVNMEKTNGVVHQIDGVLSL